MNAKPGDPTRKCWACSKVKNVQLFTKNKNGVDGYATLCLDCKKVKNARWRSGRPNYERERTLKKYGLTLQQFNDLLEAQGYVCAICKLPPTSGQGKTLHVDHCHTTRKIRGLLCHGCNTSIGHFKENVAFLQEAIAYLESHSA